ncbi:putative pre-mRNA splicing protein [Chaetomium sp. MPI-SDFR-AT-0129]|nr:putative pre-mRNA splicing protein [Chaetomium sp. MPI-SDFR-AT-0129]
MPSDKAAYLAAHYLTSDSKPSSTKKRKRKGATSASAGLLITDDDDTGWSGQKNRLEDDDDVPLTVAGTTNDFRRTKKSGWKTLGGAPISSTSTTPKPGTSAEGEAEAEAIIASAAAETAAAAAAEAADDLQPTNPNDDDANTPQMSNGTLAGLQSASSLTAQLRKRQQQDALELAALKAAAAANTQSDPTATEPEIILRDATGRRVDASLRRAEARRAAAEAERAAQAKKDLQRGEVQRTEAAARKARLDEAALMPLARGKDDEEMNEEMKRAERWNDPMAEFLGGESGGAVAASGGGPKGKGKGTAGRRPVYKGGAAPNRYGIRPGYRWDGVDRGNGFEGERFKALNRRERDKGLEYAWQMDE